MVVELLLAAVLQADAPLATATPAPKAEREAAFSRKTEADGPVLQVIFGERAVIRLDDQKQPVVMKVEKGQLADAHPAGVATETFAPPGPGEIAVALDGSAEAKKTVLKVWNGGDKPIRYEILALVFNAGKLIPRPLGGCAVAGEGVRIQSWPAPVVAVALTKFTAAPSGEAACK